MKVVLFSGGLGMRIRSDHQKGPKPMMPIGGRPVLWHLMHYYAHHGHNEFILCLGYGANYVKEYFLNYREEFSNDFVLSDGGDSIELLSSDISDWRITFVDTGINVEIAERLRRVRRFLGDDEYFLANYGDVLSDAPINDFAQATVEAQAIASMLVVRPVGTMHVINFSPESNRVTNILETKQLDHWVNGGFLTMSQEVFDYLDHGPDMMGDVFPAIARDQRLMAFPYEGFWAPMDTLKEQTLLEEMFQAGDVPWMPWIRKTEPQRPRARRK